MKKYFRRCGYNLALLLLAVGHLASQMSRQDLIAQSSIIFTGQVTSVAAASSSVVTPAPDTIVVTVDTVLLKPPAVVLTPGDRVTVVVKDPEKFKPGGRARFYTVGWIFGDTLAVQEIGSEILPGSAASALDAPTVIQMKEDADLQKRIQSADVVLTATVTNIHPDPLASADKKKFVTEHDAHWQNAVLRIDSVIKGVTSQRMIIVRFPASVDVMWAATPKFKEGQEGTFLLQIDRTSGLPRAVLGGEEVDTYVVLTAKQVLPKKEEQYVRKLFKRKRR
jgi:hypothetical protein